VPPLGDRLVVLEVDADADGEPADEDHGHPGAISVRDRGARVGEPVADGVCGQADDCRRHPQRVPASPGPVHRHDEHTNHWLTLCRSAYSVIRSSYSAMASA
jgi:hypothetical protein